MINNLTVTAKKAVTWFTTQRNTQTGRLAALDSGFFMSAALYLPAMAGWYWFQLRLERPSVCVPFCGEANTQPATLLNSPLRFGGSGKHKRSTTMAQLRQKSDQLSVYAKRVQRAIQFHLPKFGESPRILLDPNEISELSRISVDKVQQGVKELEREGYIARMFKGRRSKAHVFALLNPELKGKAGVWA